MLIYLLIFGGAVLRLLPHLPNFSPIMAVALFGGVYLSRREAFYLPLLAMLLSDVFIGFDSLLSRVIVYSAFLLTVLIGSYIKNHKSFATIVGGTLFGSALFFLITNFTYFYPPVMYPHSLQGLLTSYTNALPFFKYSLMGDFFYVGVLFGSYALVNAFMLYFKGRELNNGQKA